MNKQKPSQFAIFGLGRFGMSILQTLAEFNVNILVCDNSPAKLHEAAGYATHIVQADASDESALNTLGLGNFDVVILAMGEDFEASQVAAMYAKEQGAKYVMVKARTQRQKKILEYIGVDQVVIPEHEMGIKIARKLMGNSILDILDETEYYTISEMSPLKEWIGKTVREADIRKKHDLNILGIRSHGKLRVPAPQNRTLTEKDVLIILNEHKVP